MGRNVLARRVQGFGTSIFTEISALAVQHGAINLGQGFPDFAGPAWVKRAAAEAIAADMNQYAPSPGLPALRQSIADHWARAGWRGGVDPASEVTITSGATEALCAAILGLIDPGDEVILFEPAYDAYGPDVIMAGGVPRYVRLHPPLNAEGKMRNAELGMQNAESNAEAGAQIIQHSAFSIQHSTFVSDFFRCFVPTLRFGGGNDLSVQVRRHLFVVRKLHVIRTAAAGG
jgi:hypothetical protein